MEQFPMTQQAYDKLRAELDHMIHVERPAVAKRIAEAREEGDLRENAEYHGARESQSFLEAKIGQISYKLQNAQIVDLSAMPKDKVALGCAVTVKDMDDEDEEDEVYQIVGMGDDDPINNKILLTSPLAQALQGKKTGDIAEVNAPMGILRLKIMKIEFPE